MHVSIMPVRPYRIAGIPLGIDYDIWTNLSNSEAIKEIKNNPREFANSLYIQSLEKPLSQKQWFYVHQLALEGMGINVRNTNSKPRRPRKRDYAYPTYPIPLRR